MGRVLCICPALPPLWADVEEIASWTWPGWAFAQREPWEQEKPERWGSLWEKKWVMEPKLVQEDERTGRADEQWKRGPHSQEHSLCTEPKSAWIWITSTPILSINYIHNRYNLVYYICAYITCIFILYANCLEHCLAHGKSDGSATKLLLLPYIEFCFKNKTFMYLSN